MGQWQGSSGSQPGLGLSLLLLAVLSEAPTVCQVRKNTPIPWGQAPIQGPERQFHTSKEEQAVGTWRRMNCPGFLQLGSLEQGFRKPWGQRISTMCLYLHSAICEWRMTQDVIEHGSSKQLKNTLEMRK